MKEATKPKAMLINPVIPPDKQFIYENIIYKREKALGFYFNIVNAEPPDIVPDLIIYNVHDYLPAPQVVSSYKDVPQVCIISVDAVSQSLGHVIAYYEKCGVQAYFTAEASIWEYAPSIAHKTFHWPWGILKEDFQGLSGDKKCDVLLTTGNYTKTYHWRERVFPVIQGNLNSKNFGHFQTNGKKIIGKAFNEVLSQARIIPTCGAYNQVLVLKHLEIPASGSLLLTEETEVIKQAGFIDGVNCLFADEHNVVEKCRAVLADTTRYEQIVAAGKELVLSKHEYRTRNPIYEWFRLNQQGITQLKQETPFSPLEEGSNVRPWRYLPSTEPIVSLNIDKLQVARKEDEAVILHYINDYFLNYPGFIYRAGWFYLFAGQPERSYLYFLKIFMTVQAFKDPILLAQLAITCAALGKVKLARQIRAFLQRQEISFKHKLLQTLLFNEQLNIPVEECCDYHGLFTGDVHKVLNTMAAKYKGVAQFYMKQEEVESAYTREQIWEELTTGSKMPLRVQFLKGKIALDRKLRMGKKYSRFKFY